MIMGGTGIRPREMRGPCAPAPHKIDCGGDGVNPTELTASMTALANVIASGLSDEALREALIAMGLLRDNLQALYAHRMFLRDTQGR